MFQKIIIAAIILISSTAMAISSDWEDNDQNTTYPGASIDIQNHKYCHVEVIPLSEEQKARIGGSKIGAENRIWVCDDIKTIDNEIE